MYLVGFPLLLIPFAIYNIIALLMPGISWAEAVTRLRLPSGGEWTMSLGDMLVAFSIFLLLVEVIKAYRHGGRNFVDHGLSILLLMAMAAEFYLFPRAATATFFLMMMASFADVVGGLVAMRRRRVPVHVPAQEEIAAENPAEKDAPADAPAAAAQAEPAPAERRIVLESPRAFGVRRDPLPAQKIEPQAVEVAAVKDVPATPAFEPAIEAAAPAAEAVAPKADVVSDASASTSHETLSPPATEDVAGEKPVTSDHAHASVAADKPSAEKASS